MSFTRNAITNAFKTMPAATNPNAAGLSESAWYRNPSWLPITNPSPSEQKIVGLYRVDSQSSLIGFTISGAYTVDWGDGTAVENIAAGTKANHNYSYSAAPLVGTEAPATLTQSTSTVTRSNHGYVNGNTVSLYDIVTTTGITAGGTYYVINATTNTFQISRSVNGAAITFATGNGTCNLLNYRQAIITITPQSGQTFSSVNFTVNPDLYSTGSAYNDGWLDISMSLPTCKTILFGAATPLSIHANLEQFSLISSQLKNASYFFANCYSLRSIPVFAVDTGVDSLTIVNTATTTQTVNNSMSSLNVVVFTSRGAQTNTPGLGNANNKYYAVNPTSTTSQFATGSDGSGVITFDGAGNTTTGLSGFNADNFFRACYSLTEVPSGIAAIPNIVSADQMFYNCYALKSITGLDLTYCVMSFQMFYSCYSLYSVIGLNTPNLAYASSMFQQCYGLVTCGLFDTSNVTIFTSVFASCWSLINAPALNTSRGTNLYNMFSGCTALKVAPQLDTSVATNLSNMFYGCYSLAAAPNYNMTSVVNVSSMFFGCYSITEIPYTNFPVCTNLSYFLQSCVNLKTVPALNLPLASNTQFMFYQCYSLVSVGTLTTGANFGSTCLQGLFQNCQSLIKAPWITNTASCTNATSMFQSCWALKQVPAYNLAAVTNYTSMFQDCASLEYFPFFSFASTVTTYNSMFTRCTCLKTVPPLNFTGNTAAAAYTSLFLGCSQLQSVTGAFKFTFSVANCSLSGTALDALYTSLPTVTAQTITVTGNFGTATDTPTIATAKGWTVTG